LKIQGKTGIKDKRQDVMKIEAALKEGQALQRVSVQADKPMSVFGWMQLVSKRSLLLLVLLFAVVLSALAVVSSSYQSRTTFHELQLLRNQSNQLEVEWGQLLIEQSTFGLEGRIERKAMEELEMKVPDWSRIIMVRYE